MKKIIVLISLVYVLVAGATIEHVEDKRSKPDSKEVSKSRACFAELREQGCGDPAEDIIHFRSCMKDSFTKLTIPCQGLMNDLYQVFGP